MKKMSFSLLASAACIHGAAQAQQTEGDGFIAAVTACRAITSDSERLTCFDAAAAQLQTATDDNRIVVLTREDVQETQRTMFGFPTPDIPVFDRVQREGEEQSIDTLDSSIRAVRRLPDSRFRFMIEEGRAIWETVNRESWAPDVGDTIEIRRGAIGSYLANINGRRAIRVRRVE